jgi:hypothetical protein
MDWPKSVLGKLIVTAIFVGLAWWFLFGGYGGGTVGILKKIWK